jgi:outer membrane immunogenic protein
MKSITGAILAALALLAGSSASQAADLRRPVYKSAQPYSVAYYNWSGFYVGANAGYGFGNSQWTDPSTAITTGNFKTNGAVFGVTAGYNYQMGSVVLGVEGDYDWSTIKGTNASVVCTDCETKNPWLATFRGRVGYAFDRWLPYFTGGLAYGAIKAVTPTGSETTTKAGYALGAGVEYAFLSNWSAKIEYLYVHLADGNCNVPCGSPVPPIDVKFNTSLIRAGLNYKFSGPVF